MTEIARTKAGIIKEGSSVVLSRQEPEAAVELLKRAQAVGATVAREGIEFSLSSRALAIGGQLLAITIGEITYDEIFLPLHGKHQAANAATALAAVSAFFGGQELDLEAVRIGFAAVTSPGRCEIVHREPTIILDAAHNPHGAKALAQTLENEFTFDEIVGIFAAFADKDVEGILRELEPIINTLILTQSTSPRAMAAPELLLLAESIFGADRVQSAENISDAIAVAIADARRPSHEESIGIVITGSVVTVGEARTILKRLSSPGDGE